MLWIFSRIYKGNQAVKLYITLYRDDDLAKTLGSTKKNKFFKVFLVLETGETGSRITISYLKSTSSQYLIL